MFLGVVIVQTITSFNKHPSDVCMTGSQGGVPADPGSAAPLPATNGQLRFGWPADSRAWQRQKCRVPTGSPAGRAWLRPDCRRCSMGGVARHQHLKPRKGEPTADSAESDPPNRTRRLPRWWVRLGGRVNWADGGRVGKPAKRQAGKPAAQKSAA